MNANTRCGSKIIRLKTAAHLTNWFLYHGMHVIAPLNVLTFIARVPDSAKVKDKMLYAGSKEALSKTLEGLSVKIHASDLSEITEGLVVSACLKFQV